MDREEFILNLIKRNRQKYEETNDNNLKSIYYNKLQLLLAIQNNGYVDSVNHKFIETWNYNVKNKNKGFNEDEYIR